jgi:hypothetical protein
MIGMVDGELKAGSNTRSPNPDGQISANLVAAFLGCFLGLSSIYP